MQPPLSTSGIFGLYAYTHRHIKSCTHTCGGITPAALTLFPEIKSWQHPCPIQWHIHDKCTYKVTTTGTNDHVMCIMYAQRSANSWVICNTYSGPALFRIGIKLRPALSMYGCIMLAVLAAHHWVYRAP